MNDIERRFKYHKPDEKRRAQHDNLRELFMEFTKDVVLLTDPGREQSLMLTKLEEASFWAHADIARRQYDEEES